MEIGKIYMGCINKEPVFYLGRWSYQNSSTWIHQFEYLNLKENIAGYGQTDEQMKKENYELLKEYSVLYGRE